MDTSMAPVDGTPIASEPLTVRDHDRHQSEALEMSKDSPAPISLGGYAHVKGAVDIIAAFVLLVLCALLFC